MAIKFEWEGELPTDPSVEKIQKDLEHGITDWPGDNRNLRSLIVSVSLGQSSFKTKVKGVGYSKEDKELISFEYQLTHPHQIVLSYFGDSLPKLF